MPLIFRHTLLAMVALLCLLTPLIAVEDVNAKDKDGCTVLMHAAQNGSTDHLKALLAAGANVNVRDHHGKTALMLAGNVECIKALLTAGADVKASNADGDTALTLVASKGKVESVRTLLTAGADVNAKNNDGDTALTLAAFQGNTDNVLALIDAGADVKATNIKRHTALTLATGSGCVIALIAAGAELNAKSNNGDTALILDAFQGDLESVKALIVAGADVNIKNNDGKTALDLARSSSTRNENNSADFDKIIDALKAAGTRDIAGTDAPTRPTPAAPATSATPVTPTTTANTDGNPIVKDGKTDIKPVPSLAGIDVNARDKDGRTPLMHAAEDGNLELLKALIAAGAKVNDKNTHMRVLRGKIYCRMTVDMESQQWVCSVSVNDEWLQESLTIEEAAKFGLVDKAGNAGLGTVQGKTIPDGSISMKQIDGAWKIVAVNTDRNAQTNDNGETALILAVVKDHVECVKALIAAGADINANDDNGENALLWASAWNDWDCLNALIAAGADVNAKDNGGSTALSGLCFNGHVNCLKPLLDAGADVNAKDNDGRTALFCARNSTTRNEKNTPDFEKIIAALQAVGAQE